LLPLEKNKLVSTDGAMLLELFEESGKITNLKLSISTFGITVTGTKQ
jgi:hypothetical protein